MSQKPALGLCAEVAHIALSEAHIRDQFRISIGGYGPTDMIKELNEPWVDAGHRRVG